VEGGARVNMGGSGEMGGEWWEGSAGLYWGERGGECGEGGVGGRRGVEKREGWRGGT